MDLTIRIELDAHDDTHYHILCDGKTEALFYNRHQMLNYIDERIKNSFFGQGT